MSEKNGRPNSLQSADYYTRFYANDYGKIGKNAIFTFQG